VKLTAVCGLAALGLGAALLTACGGAAATSTATATATAPSASASTAAPETSPPSTAARAARTEAELLHLLESAPAPADHVVGTLSSRQIRDELSEFRESSDRYTANPAGCSGLAFANALDVTKGATAAAISVLPGALSMSAMSGLDPQAMGRARDALADLVDRCPEVALSGGKDGTIQSAGRRISVPARTTGVLAVRVHHVFPSGETEETVLINALRADVLLTAQVTARSLSDADLRAAAQMLDRAADQLP